MSRIGRVRHRPVDAISKIAALTLLALILLPFTAPFKTCALSATRSQPSDDQLVKDKLGDDKKLVAPSERLHVPVSLNVLATPPPCKSQVQQPPVHVTVLRI
jgi:hypothetical protein